MANITAIPQICPQCNARVWDNSTSKRSPKAPDAKCSNKGCDWAGWLSPPKGAPPSRNAPQEYNAGPYVEGLDDGGSQYAPPTPKAAPLAPIMVTGKVLAQLQYQCVQATILNFRKADDWSIRNKYVSAFTDHTADNLMSAAISLFIGCQQNRIWTLTDPTDE